MTILNDSDFLDIISKNTKIFVLKDRIELLKLLDSSKNDISAIKEKLRNDIDNILTSYDYLIRDNPCNKELKRELKELQQLLLNW